MNRFKTAVLSAEPNNILSWGMLVVSDSGCGHEDWDCFCTFIFLSLAGFSLHHFPTVCCLPGDSQSWWARHGAVIEALQWFVFGKKIYNHFLIIRNTLLQFSGTALKGVLGAHAHLLDSLGPDKAMPQDCALQLLFNIKFISSVLTAPKDMEVQTVFVVFCLFFISFCFLATGNLNGGILYTCVYGLSVKWTYSYLSTRLYNCAFKIGTTGCMYVWVLYTHPMLSGLL